MSLRNPKIQTEVRERLGVSKAELEDELKWNFETAKTLKKLNEHRAAIDSLAKLSGHAVERQEVTNKLTEEVKDAVREMVNQTIRQAS